MTHYIRNGNRYQVAPNGALDVAEILPLGTYKVGYVEQIDDYFLEKIDDFTLEGKVYGKAARQRDRILKTFDSRPGGTGVMLSGEKGSGKTMLAKMISLQGQETGVPTIVINQPWQGDSFNAFVQSIEQPAVIVFDEFEKVYNAERQEKLLTLLDGTYSSKKLFVLTCNDKWKVNEHMRNRPGRIFYRIEFGGLEPEFIREYCTDNLNDVSGVDEVVRISMLFSRFNFDILKALVEEMNRYEEGAEDALEMLNAKPQLGEKLRYKVSLKIGGVHVPPDKMHDGGQWRGNPLTDSVTVYYTGSRKPTPAEESIQPWDVEDEGMLNAIFTAQDLKRVDAATGEFVFVNAKGIEGTLKEALGSTVDYSMVY